MEKVDVAVQSFKKPESLIYTLLSLKKYCGEYIDKVYIDDDLSGDDTLKFYQNENFISAMRPIEVCVRENKQKAGFNVTLMTKEMLKRKSALDKLRFYGMKLLKKGKILEDDSDIRYQWALNVTDKNYLFICHDDILFRDNVIKEYLENISSGSNMAIVGDMVCCHLCELSKSGICNSNKVLEESFRPSKNWPVTGKDVSIIHTLLGKNTRHCRINEWCCMVNVKVARELLDKEGITFGNYERGGDVGGYWFAKIVEKGYDFNDPLLHNRDQYYEHCWQGHPGHSVWVIQKNCSLTELQKYNREMIIERLKEDFGFVL